MLAAKSFEPISDMTAVERWIMILAEELSERMIADNKLFNRRPKSLHLHYRYAPAALQLLLQPSHHQYRMQTVFVYIPSMLIFSVVHGKLASSAQNMGSVCIVAWHLNLSHP